jgi:hypothetical protein
MSQLNKSSVDMVVFWFGPWISLLPLYPYAYVFPFQGLFLPFSHTSLIRG